MPRRESDGPVGIRPVALGRVISGDEVIEKVSQSGERAVTGCPWMLYWGAEGMIRNSSPPASGSQP